MNQRSNVGKLAGKSNKINTETDPVSTASRGSQTDPVSTATRATITNPAIVLPFTRSDMEPITEMDDESYSAREPEQDSDTDLFDDIEDSEAVTFSQMKNIWSNYQIKLVFFIFLNKHSVSIFKELIFVVL